MIGYPNGWAEATLGDAVEVLIDHRGQTPGKLGGDFVDSGVPAISAMSIKDGRIDFSRRARFVSHQMFERWMPERLRRGDVLMTSEAPLGSLALVPSDAPLVLSQRLFALRGRNGYLDNRYLRWFLASPLARRQLDERSSGSTVTGIRQAELRQLRLPIPPIDQQHRIIDLLEDHLSRLDAADNYLTSGLRRANVWHQQLLTNTLWSADYPLARVGELLREPMRNGRSDRAAIGGEAGTRSLTLTAVTKNAFTEANTKVTVTAPDRARDLWLEPGDVFVQRSNTPALVGTTARYDGPREWAIFPDLLIRLRADQTKIESRFLAAALQSRPGHDQLRRKAKGLAGSMPKIDQTAIAETTIPLPPVDVQQQMLGIIEHAAEVLTLLRAELASAQSRSRVLRRALLEAAFSGRLTGAAPEPSQAEEMINA